MPFDWESLIEVARQLATDAANQASKNSEAMQRSAVTRAYFGAFGHARNYAQRFLKFETKEDSGQ